MSNLKGIVHQKNREIMTGRIAIGALLVICLVLCAIIFTAPSRLMIYNPPDLRAGSQTPLVGSAKINRFMPLLIKPSSS